jgi:hypothetical protein
MAQPKGPDDATGLETTPEYQQITAAIGAGQSVLVIGEAGSGVKPVALALQRDCARQYQTAIAVYKGSAKQFLVTVAEQWDIPTETEMDEEGRSRPLTVDQLKEEILANVSAAMVLILPESQRLPASIKYWLEDLLEQGGRLVAFAPVNPGKGFYLELLEVELALPSDRAIREEMTREAQQQGLTLSQARLAQLQPLAGRNPLLARKVIRREKLGIQQQTEHTQYLVIMPILIAALFAFAVVRFVGMGTNNKGLYITGGVCLVAAMALKQLGQVKGARKRLGQ